MRSFRNIFPFFLSSKKIYAFIRTLPLLKIIGDNYLSIWAYDKLVLDEIKKNEATDAENRSNSTVEQRKRSLDRLFRAACSWTGDNNSAAKIREQKARGNRKKKGKYLCTLQRERERRERKEKKRKRGVKAAFNRTRNIDERSERLYSCLVFDIMFNWWREFMLNEGEISVRKVRRNERCTLFFICDMFVFDRYLEWIATFLRVSLYFELFSCRF